jgi:hypothetical protein
MSCSECGSSMREVVNIITDFVPYNGVWREQYDSNNIKQMMKFKKLWQCTKCKRIEVR